MSTITIQATFNSDDFAVFQTLFKKYKVKTKILKEKEDDTKMSKEDFFKMIDERRAGEKVKMSRDEVRKIMFG